MSSTPFGEHLKREREMRGVSLEEISAATRISTRFLEAIEKDQWELLPGGVFNRGFIRSIARFLGLDEDSLVAEYALGTTATGGARGAPEQPAEMPRDYRPLIAAVVITILLIAGVAWGLKHYGVAILARLHRRHAPASESAEPPAPPAAQAAIPALAAPPSDTGQASGPVPPVDTAAPVNPQPPPSAGDAH
jgi:cytoskeletal protein RodZ